MYRYTLSLCAVTLLVATASATNPLPDPLSYAKPTPDGRFMLVAFGNADAEAKLKDAGIKAKVDAVRTRYVKPGLYPVGDPSNPVYLLDGYAPDDQVFMSSDGTHVARIEGEWWRTRAYPGDKRLSPDVESAQLDAVAVRFFTSGRVAKEYTLRELVTNPADLPHSPEHILWPAGAVLNEADGRLHLYTQDANRFTFDIATGEIVERSKSGMGNPIAGPVLWVTVGLTAALAGGILWWVLKNRKPPVA